MSAVGTYGTINIYFIVSRKQIYFIYYTLILMMANRSYAVYRTERTMYVNHYIMFLLQFTSKVQFYFHSLYYGRRFSCRIAWRPAVPQPNLKEWPQYLLILLPLYKIFQCLHLKGLFYGEKCSLSSGPYYKICTYLLWTAFECENDVSWLITIFSSYRIDPTLNYCNLELCHAEYVTNSCHKRRNLL